MQLIIDGGTLQSRESTVYSKFPQDNFHYHILTPIKNTIPVAVVRQLVQSLATTSAQPRVVWIQEADCLGVASANTLLKVLEEPPHNTIFVLTLNNKQRLLATILSRCSSLHLTRQDLPQDTELLAQLKLAMGQGIAERLQTSTSHGKDREEIANYFLRVLTSLQKTLQTTTNPKSQRILAQIVRLAQTAVETLGQNGNVTLIRDNFYLSLPRSKG